MVNPKNGTTRWARVGKLWAARPSMACPCNRPCEVHGVYRERSLTARCLPVSAARAHDVIVRVVRREHVARPRGAAREQVIDRLDARRHRALLEQHAGGALITDIRAAFDRKRVDRLSSADLLAALCEDEEAPWATWNRGRPMTARQLSARLGEFGVVSGTVRFGTHTAKGYTLDRFTDAFSRYLSSPGVSSVTPSQASNDAGLSDFPIRHNAGMLRIEKSLEASNDAGCDVVTDRTGGTAPIQRNRHAPAIEAAWEEGTL